MPSSTTDLLDVEIRPGWRLSSERSLYLESERTLVVADMHWGYAESHRRAGNLLPLWGDEALRRRLTRVLEHYRPARMIWLGDSLHTRDAAPIAEAFLAGLRPELEVVILAGNHDRKWPRANLVEFRLGDIVFHHGDRARPLEGGLSEIIGHIHPAMSLGDGAGMRLKVPVLVEGRSRVILPCFSDWSSGATWNGNLVPGDRVWIISARKIWRAGERPAVSSARR
jgi:metallophosphoesterase superfamily enzyme